MEKEIESKYEKTYDIFQSRKRMYIILINSIFTLVLIISLTYQYNTGHRADFESFYFPSQDFIRGINVYTTTTFVYLNYFVLVFPILYLPYVYALVFWIALHYIIANYIIITCTNSYDFWYLVGMSFTIVYDFVSLNVELFLAFSIIMYSKYYEKWYSPLFLLIGLYKPTFAIPIACIILYKWKKDKHFPFHQMFTGCIVCGIVLFSIYTSIEQGMFFNIHTINSLVPSFFIRPSHFLWFFYPITYIIKDKQMRIRTLSTLSFGILLTSILFSFYWFYVCVQYF